DQTTDPPKRLRDMKWPQFGAPAKPQPAAPSQKPRVVPPTSAQAPPAAGFADAFGRFSLALPPGAAPLNSTYVFGVPAGGLQVSVSTVVIDQVFQRNMQMFPHLMRQSGAQRVEQLPFDHRGRQAIIVLASLRDPASGVPMLSLNVFIPGPNIWLQVVGPEDGAQQIEETMQALVGAIQHP
ncbi:MAG: hypothetical protein N3D71_01425, partial [Burkholderiaceae bacterium]|nr:hypothetical protein [Burkholderiaceae bacterium]